MKFEGEWLEDSWWCGTVCGERGIVGIVVGIVGRVWRVRFGMTTFGFGFGMAIVDMIADMITDMIADMIADMIGIAVTIDIRRGEWWKEGPNGILSMIMVIVFDQSATRLSLFLLFFFWMVLFFISNRR